MILKLRRLMTESGQMSHPSFCSQYQVVFTFGEYARKPIILNANCETWRWICNDFGSNILVFHWSYNYSEWEFLPENTWTAEVTRCILWSSCCFPTMMQFLKMTICPHTHTARHVQSWSEEHKDGFQQHLPGQHNCQT